MRTVLVGSILLYSTVSWLRSAASTALQLMISVQCCPFVGFQDLVNGTEPFVIELSANPEQRSTRCLIRCWSLGCCLQAASHVARGIAGRGLHQRGERIWPRVGSGVDAAGVHYPARRGHAGVCRSEAVAVGGFGGSSADSRYAAAAVRNPQERRFVGAGHVPRCSTWC